MSEATSAEKADFNEQLKRLINNALKSREGNDTVRLCVEDIDAGVLIYPDDVFEDSPDDILEDIAYPVYKEDLTVDATLLIDLLVREDVRGLLSKMLVRLCINEDREVVIKNKVIYESEILARDLQSSEAKRACEKILSEKANMMSEVVRVALEQIMDKGRTEDDLYILTNELFI